MKKSKSASHLRSKPTEAEFPLVVARQLIRRFTGKSRSIFTLCDDGLYYIVKFAGNPKGRNSLANELLGYQLAESMYLPVPYSGLVLVSAALLRMAPTDWFDEYPYDARPRAGLHFATRYVGNPQMGGTLDIFPRKKMLFLANRNDFLGALVLDIWANNQRFRQVVFDRSTLRYTAYFIDCGNMFGGGNCEFHDDDFAGLYYDIEFYERPISREAVDGWIYRIRDRTKSVLSMGYSQIPSDWYTTAYLDVRPILAHRLESLEALVYPVIELLRQ